jgi:uncharacterized phiE125 gp8 family phage protein
MAYLTRDELKTYLGINGDAENDILDALLVAAQAGIDSYCDRTFEADTDTVRTFDAQWEVEGLLLYLDADLAQISSITNGDAAASAISASDYTLLPKDPPYTMVLLRDDAGVAWEGEISIAGRWAYSISAPESIKQATREYAAYLYRAYDWQGDPRKRGLDVGMPDHLKQILAGYRRLR